MVSLIDPIAESALSPRRSSQGLSALNAYQQAESSVLDGTDRFMRDRANYRAGQAMTRGDRKAAAAEYYGAGMLPEGSGVEAYDRNLAAVDEDRAAARQAADTKRQNELIKERASLLSQVAQGLKTVPTGQRKQQLDAISPIFQKVGLDTSMFSQLTENDLSDASLDTFTGAVAREVEFIKGSDGSYTAADKRTGLPMYQYQAPRQDEYKEVDPRKDFFRIPGAPGSTAGAPRNQRNNNPGNIEDGPFARSLPGYKGSDGRFAIFDSPEAGKVAQERLLNSYGARGFDTVAKVINRWAPPSDDNPTADYVAFVAQRLGVDPNQSLNLRDRGVARKLADAIEAFEGGGQSRSNGPEIVRAGNRDPEWQDLPGGGQINTVTGKKEGVPKDGRLSATAMNLQNEHLQALNTSSGINRELEKFAGWIDDGKLVLNPANNFASRTANFMGTSTPGSRNFASFKAGMEKLRNDSLRLNKGVQTEGDAVRAWNEMFENLSDSGVVRQRLKDIQEINDRAIAYRKDAVAQLREDAGMKPIDTSRFEVKPARSQGAAETLPSAALAQLKAGQITTFTNGQSWTLRDGKPQRVK